MNRWDEDQRADKYFGLTATKFNLAVFAVIGAVAIAAAVYFDGLDAAKDFLGDDSPPSRQTSAVEDPTPTATAVSEPAKKTPKKKDARPPAAEGEFEPSACAFRISTAQEIECGYLVVPEDHRDPNGPTIRLHVAILESLSDEPAPDPVVYLAGGPGQSPLRAARFALAALSPLSMSRDLIVLDQRGVGYSEPALDCHDFREQSYRIVREDLKSEEQKKLAREATAECRNRWLRRAVNLSAYTSAQNAADLHALRKALGYKRWNVYGVSYGTKLALTYMRDYPKGIRSVILDSTYPLEADLYAELIPNASRAFNRLFDFCAANFDCSYSYPELEAVFFKLVERLNEEPVTVEVDVTDSFTLEHLDSVLIDGDALVSFLFQALYDSFIIPRLPEMIYETDQGNYELLARVAEQSLSAAQLVSDGMYFSVQCAEEVPFSSQEDIDAAREAHPRLRSMIDRDATFAICEAWDVEPAAAIENKPVTSDIPALILAGVYDPITPPEWGKQVSQKLGASFFFEFPEAGHGVALSDPCALSKTLVFLDDPSVEPAGCP